MNISDVKELIKLADTVGQVPLIEGYHGIGKSESVVQYATENSLHYEPLILSLMDTGDMLGVPLTNDVQGLSSTDWAAPTWYSNIVNAAWPKILFIDGLVADEDNETSTQFLHALMYDIQENHPKNTKTITREFLIEFYAKYFELTPLLSHILRQNVISYQYGKRSVLFLDEFNRAPSDILNASLQLILEHRLHSHVLPVVNGKETLVIAAINPSSADYTVQEMDPALLDRFVYCTVDPDFKSWLRWAKKNKINDIILTFLTNNPDKFHFIPEDGSKGATPRSWVRLSKIIDITELDSHANVLSYYIKGVIGAALAAQFLSFWQNYKGIDDFSYLKKQISEQISTLSQTDEPYTPEDVASTISKYIDDLDAVKRNELAEAFIQEFLIEDTLFDTGFPLLCYLYALPMENLSTILKTLQSEDTVKYALIAKLDGRFNSKKLFKKFILKAA